MTHLEFSLVEVQGDRVRSVAGDDSDSVRERFAREAESLQARAALIGSTLGMSAVSSASVSSERGGLAFRFASDSSDNFDAKGLSIENHQFSASSLLEAVK
ncbi:MAG: hypothetical protein P1U58_04830 [Verrucomicrobiales bacterium]|nr:hypothetical protein [Verrucomicrobiales bacterium]